MEKIKEEIYKKYNSMKKLKCKHYYSFGVCFINLIPLINIFTVSYAGKLADKSLGYYDIKIEFILSMIGILLTYISILFAVLKYNFDKHNKVINGKKITKLLFRKNAFYGGEILFVISAVISVGCVISGLINKDLNSAAFNILQIGFYITIYSLSYLAMINISSETLYYIYVFRPLINDIRMNIGLNDKNVSDCLEELDEIIINICYGEEKSMYIELFDMAIKDFSKIRDWTIYELICKRVEKINEILDEKSLEILRINKIIIDYYNKLTAFEKENTWRANKQILKEIKKKYDQKSYINIKEKIEKYTQEYVALYTKYKPEFAEAIVQKFKFMGN